MCSHMGAYKILIYYAISIDDYENLTSSTVDTAIARSAVTEIFSVANQTKLHMRRSFLRTTLAARCKFPLYNRNGIIRRQVVHEHQFNSSIVVLPQKSMNKGGERFGLVIDSGDDT